MGILRNLARAVKSEIRVDPLPTQEAIRLREHQRNVETIVRALEAGAGDGYEFMVEQLTARGYTGERIAAAALSLRFPEPALPAETAGKANRETRREGDQPSRVPKAKAGSAAYGDVVVDIGSANRVEPKHLVGAITERSGLSGKEVGKIDIYPEFSVVGIPADRVGDVLDTMKGCKICGRPTRTTRLAESEREEGRPARKGSKAAQFAGERIAKRNQARAGGPVRRKRKIPDFEG